VTRNVATDEAAIQHGAEAFRPLCDREQPLADPGAAGIAIRGANGDVGQATVEQAWHSRRK